MLITGYAAAISGAMNRWPRIAFAVLPAFVMLVIVDMDRALIGYVRVSQQPLEELIVSMQKERPKPGPEKSKGP